MTDRAQPGDRLDRDLARLADDVAFPATPVFTMPRTARRPALARPGYWWRASLASGAAILVAASLLVTPAGAALADWLGFPGIRIELGDRADDPPPTVTSIGGTLLLGERVTLDEAREAAAFDLVVPAALSGGPAAEVYLNRVSGSQVVSLLYPASDALPAIGMTGVGLLLMQIDAAGNTGLFITKRAAGEVPARDVTIDGIRGLWIQGGVLMADAGDPFWTYQRRSGNVLVWERDGITYRMESNLSLKDALTLAESLASITDVP